MWDKVKIWKSRTLQKSFLGNIVKIWLSQNKFSNSKIEIKMFKFENFGPSYTSNRKRDAQCKFNQHRTKAKCFFKLGERYRALWHLSYIWGETNNFGQKSPIENRERNKHRKCHQNRTPVKYSKLGEKNCGRRCQKENQL